MAGRVDLDAAGRDAASLKRYAEASGWEDVAEFAALTLALVAELREVRLERDQLSRDASDARRQLGAAKASVVRLDDERRILRDLLGVLTVKATPHGPEIDEPGGPYVGAYLLPTGPIHRALAYLRDGAIPADRQATARPDPAAGHAGPEGPP